MPKLHIDHLSQARKELDALAANRDQDIVDQVKRCEAAIRAVIAALETAR